MNAYEKKKIRQLCKAERDLRRIATDLSDVTGSDEICRLCKQARELVDALQWDYLALKNGRTFKRV